MERPVARAASAMGRQTEIATPKVFEVFAKDGR